MTPKIGIMSLYYVLKGYRPQSTVDAIFSYWNIFNKVTLKPFRTLNGKKGPLTKDSNNVQEGWQIFFSVSSQIIKNRGLVGHTISTAATATAWNSQRVRKQVDVALFQQRFIWGKKKKKNGQGARGDSQPWFADLWPTVQSHQYNTGPQSGTCVGDEFCGNNCSLVSW